MATPAIVAQRWELVFNLTCWVIFGLIGGRGLYWLVAPEGVVGWTVVALPML